MKLALLVLLLFGLPGGCISQNGARTPVPTFSETLEGFASHEFVFKARILEVGDPPGFDSGFIAAVQHVKYKVLESYKGDLVPDSKADVSHWIIGNGFVEDASICGLRKDLIYQNRDVVLFANRNKNGIYVSGSDPLGVVLRP